MEEFESSTFRFVVECSIQLSYTYIDFLAQVAQWMRFTLVPNSSVSCRSPRLYRYSISLALLSSCCPQWPEIGLDFCCFSNRLDQRSLCFPHQDQLGLPRYNGGFWLNYREIGRNGGTRTHKNLVSKTSRLPLALHSDNDFNSKSRIFNYFNTDLIILKPKLSILTKIGRPTGIWTLTIPPQTECATS